MVTSTPHQQHYFVVYSLLTIFSFIYSRRGYIHSHGRFNTSSSLILLSHQAAIISSLALLDQVLFQLHSYCLSMIASTLLHLSNPLYLCNYMGDRLQLAFD